MHARFRDGRGKLSDLIAPWHAVCSARATRVPENLTP